MGILDKIADIEQEIARTQRNKGTVCFPAPSALCVDLQGSALTHPATEHHLGMLKAKLARFRSQLLEPTGKSKVRAPSSRLPLGTRVPVLSRGDRPERGSM